MPGHFDGPSGAYMRGDDFVAVDTNPQVLFPEGVGNRIGDTTQRDRR